MRIFSKWFSDVVKLAQGARFNGWIASETYWRGLWKSGHTPQSAIQKMWLISR